MARTVRIRPVDPTADRRVALDGRSVCCSHAEPADLPADLAQSLIDQGTFEPVDAVPDPAERLTKHKGGMWELPNGEKVRGKAKALAALAALDAEAESDTDETDTDDDTGAEPGED